MLDDAQKELLMRLFAAGSELPAAERAAFVAQACGDDLAVRQELAELLLVAGNDLAGFLARPAVAPPTADVAAAMAAVADVPGVASTHLLGDVVPAMSRRNT